MLKINADAALGAVPASPAVSVTLAGGQLINSASLSLAANRTVSLPGGGAYIEAAAGTTFNINGPIIGADGLSVVWDSGTVILSGASSYAGATTIGVTGNSYNNSAGANPILQMGRSGALPGGNLVFGASANANTATLDLHGFTNTVANLIGGANAIVDNLSSTPGTLIVGNSNANVTFNGIIRNTGAGTLGLTKIGTGTLTLPTANTYIGNTLVNAGTLALPVGGSLLSQVRIMPGATFDVSAQASPYFCPPVGGLGNSTAAATLNGPAGGTIDAVQPIYLYIDGTDPALTVAGSGLSLNGNTITIDAAAPLNEGVYELLHVAGGSLVTNGTFTVNGPAIAFGFGGTILVNGNDLQVQVVRLSELTTTTLNPVATPQTYGSPQTLTATVSYAIGTSTFTNATGTVTFNDNGVVLGTATLDGVTGVVSCTPKATAMSVVNNPQSIVAVYNGGMSSDNLYILSGSSSTPAPVQINPLAVSLGGTKTFDNTVNVYGTNMSVVGNLDGGNVYVSGQATLNGSNAGSSTVQTGGSQTPAPVSGHIVTATGDQSTGYTLTLPAAPATGNTLIATIGYRDAGDTSNAVVSVTQSGVVWTRAAGSYNPGKGISEEIWYGTLTCHATVATTVTISFGAINPR